MTVGEIGFNEFKDMLEELVANKDWLNIVEELLLLVKSQDDGTDNMEERKARALQHLECMDREIDDAENNLIFQWMLILHLELKTVDEDASSGDDADAAWHTFHSCFAGEIDICVVRFINTFLNRSVLIEGECKCQAEAILQALQSDAGEINLASLENEEKETIHFWKKVIKFRGTSNSNSNSDNNDSSSSSPAVMNIAPTIVKVPPPKSNSGAGDDNSNSSSQRKRLDPEAVENIVQAGDVISGHIYSAAKLASKGLTNYVAPAVSKGIEVVGDIIIDNTAPASDIPSISKEEDSPPSISNTSGLDIDMNSALSITEQSVKATDSIRRGTRTVAFGIRDFSTRQVHNATTTWKRHEIGKQIIPDDDVREAVVATGKVGIATLGAAALLTESIFETTKAVAETSVKVASDVAEHKYGEEAGKVVNNAGTATGNVLRTVTHVATLEAQVLTRAIARNTAKTGMEEKAQVSAHEQCKGDAEVDEDAKSNERGGEYVNQSLSKDEEILKESISNTVSTSKTMLNDLTAKTTNRIKEIVYESSFPADGRL